MKSFYFALACSVSLLVLAAASANEITDLTSGDRPVERDSALELAADVLPATSRDEFIVTPQLWTPADGALGAEAWRSLDDETVVRGKAAWFATTTVGLVLPEPEAFPVTTNEHRVTPNVMPVVEQEVEASPANPPPPLFSFSWPTLPAEPSTLTLWGLALLAVLGALYVMQRPRRRRFA